MFSLLRKHSTAQHSKVQSTRTSSKSSIRADQSAITQASRRSCFEPACRRVFIQLAVFPKRTKKSKSARPTKMHNQSQSGLDGVMLPALLFLSVILYRSCFMRPGLFRWTMELLASASRQFTPKTMDLSVRFVHSHFVQFFLASDRNGRQKPLAERSAL